MEYPKTDAEIRIYCLESTKSEELYSNHKPDLEAAQKMYNFICPSLSMQGESRKRPLASWMKRVLCRRRQKH